MIYLATPYSHLDKGVELERFENACRIAGRLMAEGHIVFCPIAHTHPIATRCDLPRTWDFWSKQDFALLDIASKLVVAMMSGWEDGRGVKAEIERAERRGIPIEYLVVDE